MATKVDYHRYMASREWAIKKEAVKERAGNKCERCKTAPMQNTHHLSYEHLGDEPLDELQGVCRPCHKFLSAKQDEDPAVTRIIELLDDHGMEPCYAENEFKFWFLTNPDGPDFYIHLTTDPASEPLWPLEIVIDFGLGVWAHCN